MTTSKQSQVINSPSVPIQEPARLYFWVADQLGLGLKELNPFIVMDFGYITGDIPEGNHYILSDSHSTEENVRFIGYTIEKAGGKVFVYQPHNTITNLLPDGSVARTELLDQITDSPLLDDWIKDRCVDPIELDEALTLAKIEIRFFEGNKRFTRLDKLRERCNNMASFRWDKCMDNLVAEFIAELRNRGIEPESLRDRIRAVLDKCQTSADKTLALSNLSTETNKPLRELEKIADELLAELELSDSRSDNFKEVEQLLKLQTNTLSLFDYLPTALAKPLTDYANWMNLRPECILLPLLAATSSLHKVGTEVLIHKSMGFSQPPIIFGAVVAESGQKKSPLMRQIVSKPMARLHQNSKAQHAKDLAKYESDMEQWDAKSGNLKPEKPIQEVFYFNDANGEGIRKQASQRPDKPLLAMVDELAGFFNSQNQYRGGRGSEKQDLLSYYDGWGAVTLRASGVTNDVERIYLSIFGTIQPEVIKTIMGDNSDPDGSWARFLFAHQPLVATDMPDDDGSGIDITDLIFGFYDKLHKVPQREYKLSKSAFKIYQPYYKSLEQLKISHPQQAMRAVYSKAEGYTGRLALNLHVLDQLAAGIDTPSLEIPKEIIIKAIKLMNFFIGQTKLLYSSFDEGLAPHITKLIEMSKGCETTTGGWIKARDVQNSTTKKSRPTADIVRLWMREAESMGLGSIRGTGRSVEFSAKVDKVDDCSPKVDAPSTGENLDITTSESKVDKVDDTFPLLDKVEGQLSEHTEVDTLPSTINQSDCDEDVTSIPVVDSQSTPEPTYEEASTFDENYPMSSLSTSIEISTPPDVKDNRGSNQGTASPELFDSTSMSANTNTHPHRENGDNPLPDPAWGEVRRGDVGS